MPTWWMKRREKKARKEDTDNEAVCEDAPTQQAPFMAITTTRGQLTIGATTESTRPMDAKTVTEKCWRHLKGICQSSEDSRSVNSLMLMHADLQAFPGGIVQLCNITSLLLPHNAIGEIPTIIAHLARLRVLDLSFNRLTSLPSFLGTMLTMQDLNFRHNAITSLPTAFLHLDQLKAIDLRDNSMVSPPQVVCDQGKDAVLETLRRRLSRRNEWEGWRPCPGGEEVLGKDSQGPQALMALAARRILNSGLDFQASPLPPVLKTFLQDRASRARTTIRLFKCDRCHAVFSREEKFVDHDC